MGMDAETLIRIVPGQGEVIVERHEKNIVSRKMVTPETLAKCFLKSKFDTNAYHTGLLPEGCIAVTTGTNETWYFIRHPELQADITYFGTEYVNFPLPRMVFAFRYLQSEQKVASSRVCVIPDKRIRLDMETFFYPFSNVSSTGGTICTGNNVIPAYPDPTRLSTLPDYILRLPNNNDYFSAVHNKPHMEYRDLLELLKDKESSYYYSDILIPDGKTLKDFISGK